MIDRRFMNSPSKYLLEWGLPFQTLFMGWWICEINLTDLGKSVRFGNLACQFFCLITTRWHEQGSCRTFFCSDAWELMKRPCPFFCWFLLNFFADDTLLTRVVNTGLDDVIHGEATGGGLAPQLVVDVLGQHLQQTTASAGWWLHAHVFSRNTLCLLLVDSQELSYSV